MLITFEGIEAAGKSTLIAALADDLRLQGVDVLVTREPGGTPLGDAIRKLFVDPSAAIDPVAEVMLMNASRAQLVAGVIAPALRRGTTVLCDRFFDATIAYQGFGRGLDVETVIEVSLIATSRISPDLTILLDLSPETSARRLRERGAVDRLEREGLDFHARVRAGYLNLARRFARYVVLDAERSAAEVLAAAADAIAQHRDPHRSTHA